MLTDSGGIQEETSALGIRCFTLRDTTERPVTVELGTNTCSAPTRPRSAPDPGAAGGGRAEAHEIPLWDGAAGPRAAEVLRRELG